MLLALAPAVATAQAGTSPKAMPQEDMKDASSDGSAPVSHVALRDTTKLCFERPTKSSAPCVLPKGCIQLESDIGNWTVNSYAGARIDTIEYVNPTLKYGLGDYTDIEANIAPYVEVRSRDDTGVSHLRGVGDLTLRLKHRLTNPNRTVRYAVVGIVKVPTARLGIGNRQLEGGVTAPVVVKLHQGFALTVSPEADLLTNNDHPGRRHLQIVMAAVLQKPVTSRLTAFGELWTSQNYDPSGHIHQYSADVAVAYMLTPKFQIDLGGNIGLNHQTPNAQIIAGFGTRF
ncbi:transporter [Sphingomonas sp. PAMC 26617]|uniref:transporter n=1 Tax=Sphingomonas sp. PAMC 26617 TaxID=1112216 RepID=UPI00028842D0|nr:transporter [Sphingomonas sp. PAMC 26617]